MTHGYGAMPDYSAQLDAGRPLGSGGLYPRAAVEPGGHAAGRALRRAGARASRASRQRRASLNTPSRGRCLPRPCRLIRRSQGGHAGNGSGQSRRPGDQDSRKQTGPRGRRSKDKGMAHETHAATHAKTLPADSERTGLCRRLAETRAHGRRAVFSVIAAGAGRFRRLHRSRAARMAAWPHAHLRLVGRRTGPADGAVLLRRQVGPAAASASRSHEPHPAPGLRLLAGGRPLHEEALPVGQSVTDVNAALKSGFISEIQAHCLEFKRPMLNPTRLSWSVCFASPSGASIPGGSIRSASGATPNRPATRPTGSRSSKTSAAPASWSTRSP